MRESILIVDDEAGVRSSLVGILGDEGYAVDSVDSGEAALKAIENRRFDLLLLDVWMPGMDGLETLARIRTLDALLPVVVISGPGSIETAVKAVRSRSRRRCSRSRTRCASGAWRTRTASSRRRSSTASAWWARAPRSTRCARTWPARPRRTGA